MAKVTQFGYMDYSELYGAASFTASLIDASGEQFAMIVKVPKTGNISKVLIRVTTVSTSRDLRVSLQTVDLSTGNPTGTLYGGSAAGVQASPSASTSYVVTLGTPASATIGDYVAVVVEFDSTVGSVNLGSIVGAQGFPYVSLYTGTWAKSANIPLTAFEYDDGSYPILFGIPYYGVGSTGVTFNLNTTSGSGGDERGLRFSVPFPCALAGLIVFMNITSGGDFDLVLYDESNNVLASQSFDGNVALTASALQRIHCLFTTAINLSANTTYRITVKPTTNVSVTIYQLDFPSTTSMDSLYRGQYGYRTVRTDAGAWTDTTTGSYQMCLIYNAFENGVSGDLNQ